MKIVDAIRRRLNPLEQAKQDGMRVGNNVTLASKLGTTFGSEPYLIYLDDEVRISGGVHFITHDGGTHAFRDLPPYNGIQKYGHIFVGKRTFIGYGAIIMPGVTIGERCVIGAGSIVTKNVPEHSVVAGIPAKYICSTEEYAKKCVNNTSSIEEAKLKLQLAIDINRKKIRGNL